MAETNKQTNKKSILLRVFGADRKQNNRLLHSNCKFWPTPVHTSCVRLLSTHFLHRVRKKTKTSVTFEAWIIPKATNEKKGNKFKVCRLELV